VAGDSDDPTSSCSVLFQIACSEAAYRDGLQLADRSRMSDELQLWVETCCFVSRASSHSSGERSNSSNGRLDASGVPVERIAMSASLRNPPSTLRAF
jgi:hypothetical protein